MYLFQIWSTISPVSCFGIRRIKISRPLFSDTILKLIFRHGNCCVFIQLSVEFVSSGPDKNLAPNVRRAVICTNGVSVYWRICHLVLMSKCTWGQHEFSKCDYLYVCNVILQCLIFFLENECYTKYLFRIMAVAIHFKVITFPSINTPIPISLAPSVDVAEHTWQTIHQHSCNPLWILCRSMTLSIAHNGYL